MIFQYDFPEEGFLAYSTAVRQIRTERRGGEEVVSEARTRSRFSQRAVDLGEVVLTLELSVESATMEIPSLGLPPFELEGFPRVGRVRMERNGTVLEMPGDMPVGRGLVFPARDLEPGDSWQVTEKLENGRAVVEHTFAGWEEDLALFSSRSLDYRAEADGALLEGALEAETLFDPEAGRAVRALSSFTTRVRSGEEEILTQVASHVELEPLEGLGEAHA